MTKQTYQPKTHQTTKPVQNALTTDPQQAETLSAEYGDFIEFAEFGGIRESSPLLGSGDASSTNPAYKQSIPHVVRMQSLIGNAAVQRLLKPTLVSGREAVQRTPRSGAAATSAVDPEAQARETAQQLIQVIQTQGGLNLALYLINVNDTEAYDNDDEFLTQARQYARDHMTFGIRNSRLQRGVEIGIDQSHITEVEQVLTAANELIGRFPDLYTERPTARVQTLNIFAHGGTRGLEAGASTARNRWMGAQRFATGLATHLTATPTINLYACNTAGTVASGGPNFATAVQEQITRELQETHGADAHASVWGHTSARHTTFNPDLVGVGAGDGIRTNLGARLVERAVAQRGLTQATDEQRSRLQPLAETVFRHVFDVHRRAGDASVGNARMDGQRNFTSSNDPRQTYFRDIPLLGYDRVWSDLTAASDPTNYGDLGMSEEATARMAQAAAFFRARFQTQLTSFNTQATVVLGSEPSVILPEPAPVSTGASSSTTTPPSTPPPPQRPPVPTPPQPASSTSASTITATSATLSQSASTNATPPVPASTSSASDRPILRRGSRGQDVRDLQQRLNARGANPSIEVDGAFGRGTEAAVRQFQQQAHLDVDGIAGPQTWGALLAAPTAAAATA